jgi:SWI/SNF-related matrix-associated actin-dependent regulator 1 of chromatin subfamily A
VLKTNLLPHQLKTLEFALGSPFYFDLSDPGTGKTLSALAVISTSRLKAIVICPPHLVNNWLAEADRHTTLKASPHFLKYNPDTDIFVVPYTKVKDSEDVFKHCKVVVCDELHYIKNLESQRTRAVHTLMYKYTPEYFLGLTGTVLKNRIPELYSPLILLGLGKGVYPKILDHYRSYYTFCYRFTNVRQTQYGAQFSGSKNVEELRTFLKPYCIKHSESVVDLPELSEIKVVVDYKDDPELARAFEEFQSAGVGANITAKTRSAEAKAKFTANYVGSLLDQDSGPVVVFSDHRKSISIIELELSTRRVRSITGDTSMEKRNEYVKMLNSGQLDSLICSIGAASSGLTLTGASKLVFNDVPFVPGDLVQAKKRIHRISQTKPCQIVYVVGSKVDDNIINMLNSKNKTITKVLGGI